MKYFFFILFLFSLKFDLLFINKNCDVLAQPSNHTKTFERILRCFSISKSVGRYDWKSNSLSYPPDALSHYLYLMEQTSMYRNITPHTTHDYSGPWVENHFIDHFMSRPLQSFGGMIPLFVQWVDIHVHEMLTKKPKYKQSILFRKLEKLLRPNVLYVTVSQDDEGIGALQRRFPNILTLSAGGYGHIPLPLIKGELLYREIPRATGNDDMDMRRQFRWDVGFVGSRDTHPLRSEMIGEVRCLAKGSGLVVQLNSSGGGRWREDIAATRLNLAPRGFGRTSYRLAEILQLGRVPLYVYDDVAWVAYEGTDKDVVALGYVAQIGTLEGPIGDMSRKSAAEFAAMLGRVRAVRAHYTYAGVMGQMERFFADPLGPAGGDLRCKGLPPTPN